MILRHVALTCRSEKKSDLFFKELFGLEKSEPKILPASLSKAIFNADADLPMIHYRGKAVHFEVFICDPSPDRGSQIEHVCVEVDNLQKLLKKCHDLDVDVSRIPRGDRTLTFIRDFDGNLFEIKQKRPDE